VSPVRYELGFRIPEDGILHSHRRENLNSYRIIPSSGTLRCVALVITDVSEERSALIIRATEIGELGTTLAVTSNRRTLRRKNY
jgi:hypothetical protein